MDLFRIYADKQKSELPSSSPHPYPHSLEYTLKTHSQHVEYWIPIHEFPDEQANHEIKCKQVNLGNVYSKIFLSLFLIPLHKCVKYNYVLLFMYPKTYSFVPLGKFILL